MHLLIGFFTMTFVLYTIQKRQSGGGPTRSSNVLTYTVRRVSRHRTLYLNIQNYIYRNDNVDVRRAPALPDTIYNDN